MRFTYGKQDMYTLERAQENCFLLTNGLGGYASLSAGYSVTRGDQGILISAESAPNVRHTLVQRLQEKIRIGETEYFLSSQMFVRGSSSSEEGYRYLTSFTWDGEARWSYDVMGVSIIRRMSMKPHANMTAITYEIENHTDQICDYRIVPGFLCAPKGSILSSRRRAAATWNGECVTCSGYQVYVRSNLEITEHAQSWERVYYADDAPDGRKASGLLWKRIELTAAIAPGRKACFELIFSDQKITEHAEQIFLQAGKHRDHLLSDISFPDEIARELVCSADAYISQKTTTGGETVVAGYPFFGDWGRDTMIALPGCALATNRFKEAESILRTFLSYEKEGLVPNLFPEGGEEPRYNTVDAALLLINCVWLFYQKTGNRTFLQEAYPVMERIIEGYRKGTMHRIRMEEDGLISAGEGLDQVTWMDVCVNGILPTPRHGKPVEINAYWYNALRIMEIFAEDAGENEKQKEYASLAKKVKEAFCKKFWMEEKGCLRDVLSQTEADEQIRCNQIWAVTMPFSMLDADQEKRLVETVYRELYTPCGLRTLSPKDPQFQGSYGGLQLKRDLAYHQGTVWVFPLGAFYRAWLKVNAFSPEARSWVRDRLQAIGPMLREGCIGQLPEIYEGSLPGKSKGCFAQAWSVGEILTVYEALETG